MIDPTALFKYEPHVDQRTIHARTLVVTVGSFMDAGGMQRLINDHLHGTLSGHLLGRMDADQLHDYGGRRPYIEFDRDHFTGYSRPDIQLHQMTDAAGESFLLLSGPEPSLKWETAAASIQWLVEQHDVERVVLVQGIPAPVPHTRPIQISRYASDLSLLTEEAPFLGSFTVSASFPAVLSVRLGEAGHAVVGLVAHVPHYLAEGDHPASAAALMDALESTSGLALPHDELRLAAIAADGVLNERVAQSEELRHMLAELETGFDEFMAGQRRITAEAEDLPTADEIGAAAEEFLRGLGGEGPDMGGVPDAGDVL